MIKLGTSYFLLLFVLLIGFSSCKKEDPEPAENPTPTITTDTSDLSVSFNNYTNGITYNSDTIRFNFAIKNLHETTINQGKKIQVASKFGSTTFALDLIGAGPTMLTVPSYLYQNQSFNHDAGYLPGSSVLAYFGVDSIDISIIVYGPEGAPVNENFPYDRTPGNNITTLRIKPNLIVLQ
jgi:hypothetical protein